MAANETRKVDLTALDRAYLKRGLASLEASIRRAMSKETPGSEIVELRRKELAFIAEAMRKLG